MKLFLNLAATTAIIAGPCISAHAAADSMPRLKGNVLFSAAWTEDNAPQGFYYIPTGAGELFELSTKGSFGTFGNFTQGDYYFTSERISDNQGGFVVSHVAWNPETGDPKGGFTTTDTSQVAIDCATDPVTGTVYGATYDKTGTGFQLSRLNFTTTSADAVKIGSFNCEIAALACDASGQLWAISRDRNISGTVTGSRLLKVNKNDASYTVVGSGTGCLPHYLSSATIDAKSGRMFWVVSPVDDTSSLYEVDLNTGMAKLIYNFPDAEQVVGLVSEGPAAADKAPEMPVNLRTEFEGGSLGGKFICDIPSTTYDGAPASGSLNYTLSIDDATAATGTTTYGAALSIDVRLSAPGEHKFTIQTSSPAGSGPKATLLAYVGYGVPKAPANVTATYSSGKATLTWDAVTGVTDGGYINPAEVTYTVLRDGKTLKSGLTATTFSEDVAETAGPSTLTYAVRAVNGTRASSDAMSNTIACGSVSVPFRTDFTTGASSLDGYTVIDANNDGRTWAWGTLGGRNGVRASYNTDHVTPMDDWLVTPALDLKGGTTYSLRVKMAAMDDYGTVIPEVFEVKYGTGNTAAELKTPLIAKSTVSDTTPTDFSGSFTPEADGTYFIGVHCISPADKYYLFIDELSLTTGQDLPKAPASLTLRENPAKPGEVTVSWPPVTSDLNGNAIPASDLSYNIYTYDAQFYEWSLLRSGVKESSLTFDYLPEGYDRCMASVAVTAVAKAGEGPRARTDIFAVGKPYTEIQESAAGSRLSTLWYFGGDYERNYIFSDSSLRSCSSSDGDDGYFAMRCTLGKTAFLQSAKIDFSKVTNPGVSFYTYAFVSGEDLDTNDVTVEVRRSGEDDFNPVYIAAVNEISDFSTEPGWYRCNVDLKDYAGQTVELRLCGTIKSFSYVMFDNITVGDMPETGMAISDAAAPMYAYCGEDFSIMATVTNKGVETATGWKAVLLDGDKEVSTIDGEELEAGEACDITFVMNMNPANDADRNYTIRLDMPGDNDLSDNVTPVLTVGFVAVSEPAPSALTAETSGTGVALSWKAPELGTDAKTVTEDFENARDFAHIYSDWGFIDLDMVSVGGFKEFTIPGITNSYSLSSFFVFNPSALSLTSPFEPKSGEKYLTSLMRWDDETVDDWAVSPLLSGNAQEISFYARSFSAADPEKVEVLWSDGSLVDTDFKSVMVQENLPAAWTLYKAALPQGARRFAIRSNATAGFMLMVDDVTYQAAPESEKYRIKGYNVYRNGEKITDEPVAATSLLDSKPGSGDNVYVVTAVYNLGESTASNAVTYNASGVEAIDADSEEAVYYNLQGIRVENPTPGIYIRRTAGGSERILVR